MAPSVNERLLARMRDLITEYEAGTVSLRGLVDGLEGNMRAMDPSVSSEEEALLMEMTMNLEVALATGEEDRYRPFIEESLEKLKQFLPSLEQRQ